MFLYRLEGNSEWMKYYLVESLFYLMHKKPLNEISVQEIVDKAGVSRSTYYRMFKRREEIIAYYLEEALQGYFRECGASDIDADSFCAYFLSAREELKLIYDNGLLGYLLEAMNRWAGIYQGKPSSARDQKERAWKIGGIFNSLMIQLEQMNTACTKKEWNQDNQNTAWIYPLKKKVVI